MDSYYQDERTAALQGKPYFATRVGPGYDQIPTSEIYHGFGRAFDDRRQENAAVDPHQHRNTPQHRASLYADHADDGLPHMGYYKWEPERITHDMAPDFVKSRVPQSQQIGRCVQRLHELEPPIVLNSNVHVGHAGERQRDGGNPIGVLYDPPALGPKLQGTNQHVPSFFYQQ